MSTAPSPPVSVMGRYLSLIKFSHTVFALPFAAIGFTLAVARGGAFTWRAAVCVLLCMIFARSAAMAFNRWLDRAFDALNPRTAVREIPAGAISPQAALLFTILCSAGFVMTTWFINPLCFVLSFVALFVVLFYSYTKRFTPLCHLVLGVGLALAPIGAYLAVTGAFAVLPLLYSLAVLTWVAGFDIIYALQDEDFDRAHGLRSIPAALGKVRALRLSERLHAITATLILFAGWYRDFHPLYWLGATLFLLLLLNQHRIVKPHDLSRVNAAFGTMNGIASVVLAVFTITAILLKAP